MMYLHLAMWTREIKAYLALRLSHRQNHDTDLSGSLHRSGCLASLLDIHEQLKVCQQSKNALLQAILMTVAGLCGIFAQAVVMRILVACLRETQIIIIGRIPAERVACPDLVSVNVF